MKPFYGLRGLGTLGAVVLLLSGSGAFALDGPKVVITYSLEGPDGGQFVQNVDETPLTYGNIRFIMDDELGVQEGDDVSQYASAEVLTDSPQYVVIEYTADEVTEEIVSGPVELTDSYMRQVFQIVALGNTTTTTDQTLTLAREGIGTFDSGTGLITFDNETPYQHSNNGVTNCSGFWCFLSGPWPRYEYGDATDVPLPLFTVRQNVVLGDAFSSDNDTPLPDPPPEYYPPWEEEKDDMQTTDKDDPGEQASTYMTWHGVEIDREYVPEPGSMLLLVCGTMGLFGLNRLRRRGET